jgi:hypothetical protein
MQAPVTAQPSEELVDTRFDFASMRLSQEFAAGRVRKTVTTIISRKPSPHWWVRVHPELSYATRVFENKEDSEQFLVAPDLQASLSEMLVAKLILPAVTRQGTLFLWAMRLPDETGRLDSWNRSAMDAANIAKKQWVRVISNRQLGGYDVAHPFIEIPEPVWPEMSMEAMLSVAFKHYLIDKHDHPRLQALRGEI